MTTGNQERTSFTFFYYPSYEAQIPQVQVPHDTSIIYTNQATGEAIDPTDIEVTLTLTLTVTETLTLTLIGHRGPTRRRVHHEKVGASQPQVKKN